MEGQNKPEIIFYQVEGNQNSRSVVIHLSKRITDLSIEHFFGGLNQNFDKYDCGKLIKALLSLNGVTELFIQPYKIHAILGVVFDRTSSINLILDVISKNISNGGVMVELEDGRYADADTDTGCRYLVFRRLVLFLARTFKVTVVR